MSQAKFEKMTDCELLQAIKQCDACAEQLPLAPEPILQFSSQAKLLIVGQAPGQKAHDAGWPFADVSGQRLREWLGLDDETFYDAEQVAILPMGFCYPGRGKSGDLPPLKACAELWREELLRRLQSVELTVVLGQYAINYHLPGYKGVTEAVRDWQVRAPAVFPLPHPSPRNQYWLKQNPWFESERLPALQQQIRWLLAENAVR